MTLATGARLNHCEILSPLGACGMCEVLSTCASKVSAWLIEATVLPAFLNPPDGNRGMVKVRPTQKAATRRNPPDGNRGMVKVQPLVSVCEHIAGPGRLHFNHPPIAIGGI